MKSILNQSNTKGGESRGPVAAENYSFRTVDPNVGVVWETVIATGGYQQASEQGFVRPEGRERVVQDGDVLLFRFDYWPA